MAIQIATNYPTHQKNSPLILGQQDLPFLNQLASQLQTVPRETCWRKVHVALMKSHIAIARDTERDDMLIGMATLVPNATPLDYSGRIEDVVVDESYRGLNHGASLVRYLIQIAKYERMSFIVLTSNSKRVNAIRLYQRLGFRKTKNTDVYQLGLTVTV